VTFFHDPKPPELSIHHFQQYFQPRGKKSKTRIGIRDVARRQMDGGSAGVAYNVGEDTNLIPIEIMSAEAKSHRPNQEV